MDIKQEIIKAARDFITLFFSVFLFIIVIIACFMCFVATLMAWGPLAALTLMSFIIALAILISSRV